MFARSNPRKELERALRMVLSAVILFNATLPSVALASVPNPDTQSAEAAELNNPRALPEQAPQYFSPPAYTIPQQTSPEPDRPESPIPARDQVEFILTADPAIVPADGLVKFNVIIRNNSEQSLTGVAFVDALETGFEYSPGASASVTYNERSRLVNWDVDQIAAGEEITFSYSLNVTTSRRNATSGKLWLRKVELNANAGALNLKTSAAVGVDLPVADEQARIATLSPEGHWNGLGRVAVHMEQENIGRDGAILLSPARIPGNGPELQFKLEVYETTSLSVDTQGTADEQAINITGEFTGLFTEPAFLEINLDEVIDLKNVPAGQEPYVATYDETHQIWVKVPILEQDHEQNTVTVAAAHFSTWGAGLGSSLPQNGANVLLFDQPYTSLFTGSSRYSIPIWTPPGRGGMQPDVSLSYSSGTVDGVLGDVQAPWVGVGWNIDAVEIVRKITTDENGYGYRNEFALTLNGALYQLVRDENSQNRYYTDQAAFLYVERHNHAFDNTPSPANTTGEWWEVVTTDGTRYRLGWKDDSEQLALMYGYSCTTGGLSCITPNGAYASLGYAGKAENLVAMRWRVDRVTDANGNYMAYAYTETQPSGATTIAPFDRESYLDTISYTGFQDPDPQGQASPLDPGYQVKFTYAPRSTVGDIPVEFNVWDNIDSKLLSMIELICLECTTPSAQEPIRTYTFRYTLASAPNDNGTLTLTSLDISGGDYTENGRFIPPTIAPTIRFTYQDKPNRASGNGDVFNYPRLATIENGSGGRLTFTYEHDGRGNNSWYNYRVKNVVAEGGMGVAKKQSYTYATPVYSGQGGNSNLGSLTGYTTTTESVLDFNNSDAKILDTKHTFGTVGLDIGRELQTELLTGGATTVLQKTTNVYVTDNSMAPFQGWNYRYLGETASYVRSGSALVLTTKSTYYNDPATGNPLVQNTYLGNSLYRKTYYEYLTNPNPAYYLLDKVSRVLLVSAGNQIYSDTRYHYDGRFNEAPTQGNVTLVQKLTGNPGAPNETVDTATGYDVYGNATSTRAYKSYGTVNAPPNMECEAPACIVSRSVLDTTFQTYPVTATDPLGNVSTTNYLFTLGAPYQTTDPNQWTTQTTYDGLGRTLSVTPPGLNQPGTWYTYPTPSNGIIPAPHAVEMQILDTIAGTYRSVWGIYDGMGRMLQTQVDAGNQLLVNTTLFNPQGLPKQQSLPYYVNGAGGNHIPQAGNQFTLTEYDALGRVTKVTAPGNIISQTSYDGLTTTALDPNGNKVTRTTDGLGRMTAVREYSNPSTVYATTQYFYDAADRLVQVTDAQNNTTIIQYNWLGQKLEMNDPDMGDWYYLYDSLGNMASQTDARAVELTFDYDDLNRLILKQDDDPNTPNIAYTYGTTPGTIGLRTAMSDASGSTTWSYSNYGRSVFESRTIGGQTQTITTHSDWLGRPMSTTYGDGEILTYRYDELGRPEKLESGQTTLVDLAYNTLGQIWTQTLGNGVVVTNTYNSATTRLTNRSAGNGTLLNLSYLYDANGNITRLTDHQLSETHFYQYDFLNRLTSAVAGNGSLSNPPATPQVYGQQFEYDKVGNMLQMNAWGTPPTPLANGGPIGPEFANDTYNSSSFLVSYPLPAPAMQENPTATPTPTTTNTPTPTDSGWISPNANAAVTSSSGDNNGFQTNPGNAYGDDATFAVDTDSGTNTKTSCTDSGKDRHIYSGYDFSSIPGGSTILGIEVRLDMLVDSTTGSPKACIQLSWDNGTTWTTAQTSANFTTAEATYLLGGAGDTWGRTWTTSELSNLRVRITNIASNTARGFSLDWIPVRVSYNTAAVTATSTPTSASTFTNTATFTATASLTPTFVPTNTSAGTSTASATPTATPTINTPTKTFTPASTPTPSRTPTITATTVVPDQSLKAYWDFENVTGTNVPDEAPNDSIDNDASLLNGATIQASGAQGASVAFDGTNGYASIPNDAEIKRNGSFTISAWVNPASVVTDRTQYILKKGTSNFDYGFITTSDITSGTATPTPPANVAADGNLVFRVGDLTPNKVAGPILPANTWTLVTGVYDSAAGELRLYLNGTLAAVEAVTGSLSMGNGNLTFSGASPNQFHGALDEIRFYNRALTESEVVELFGAFGTPTPLPSITATATSPATFTPTASPLPVSAQQWGTSADGSITINTGETYNINASTSKITGRSSCVDAPGYSVASLGSTVANLSTTPGSGCLAAGDEVLLINLKSGSLGTYNTGTYEFLRVASVSGNSVNFTTMKSKWYGEGFHSDANIGTGAGQQRVMLMRVPNYANVTISSGGQITASAFNGDKFGVVVFRVSGTLSGAGTISADAVGFAGGPGGGSSSPASGYSPGGNASPYPNNWGYGGSGGGGGHATAGVVGTDGNGDGDGGPGGSVLYGAPQLNKLYFGSGGGGSGIAWEPCGTSCWDPYPGPGGGSGGGIVLIAGQTINFTGSIVARGQNKPTNTTIMTGGGGSGGSIRIEGNTITLGTLSATGGSAGAANGAGGTGRIAVYRQNSSTISTSNPAAYLGTLGQGPTPTPSPTPISFATPNPYGTGADGSITVSTTFNLGTDKSNGRNCADGSSHGVSSLTASTAKLATWPGSGCFSVNDEVLLIHLSGSGANIGVYEFLRVGGIVGDTIYFKTPKVNYYGSATESDSDVGTGSGQQRVMLMRVPNYANVTISSGGQITASAFNGSKFGVVVFRVSGTLSGAGTISADAVGFAGGPGGGSSSPASGYGPGGNASPNPNNWGFGGSGGGGSHSTAGTVGVDGNGDGNGGSGSTVLYGAPMLDKLYFGSGGGGSGKEWFQSTCGNPPTACWDSNPGPDGGRGGGIVLIAGQTINFTGSIIARGQSKPTNSTPMSGGGGSGGSIRLEGNTITLGTISANGGSPNATNGAGGTGRIAIYYASSLANSTTLCTQASTYCENTGSVTPTVTPSPTATPTNAPVTNPGTTDLVAWWTLSESSGTRNDSHGVNHLADSYKITSTTGKVGSAALFVPANNAFLTVVDNPAISAGDVDFTLVANVYLNVNNNSNSFVILDKSDAPTPNLIDYRLVYNSGTGFRFRVSPIVYVDSGAATANAWHTVVAWHDSVNNTINIQVDNGSINTVAFSDGTVDTSYPLTVGGYANLTGILDGRIDEVTIMKRVLTAAERTWLYNNGAGRTYSDTASGFDTTGMVAWWTFNEANSVRNDSHGNHHLFDSASVDSIPGMQGGTAARFVKANQEVLTIPDNAAVSTGDINYTLAAWVYMSSKSTTMTIASKYGPAWPAAMEYSLLWHQSTDRFMFFVGNGTTTNSVSADVLGSPQIGQWYYVVAWHNAATNEIGISVNNIINTASTTITPTDNTYDFRIGNGGVAEYWDGVIDEVAFYKRVLTAAERTWLYNSGAGRTYSELNTSAGWYANEYTYTGDQPHAVTAIDRVNFTDTFIYDANGNMTCRVEAGITYLQTYNTENRIASVAKLANGSCATPGNYATKWDFTYDGDGVRTATLTTPYDGNGQPQTPSLTRYFFGGALETTGSDVTKYYSFTGQTIAMKDSDGVKYFLTDHLGSVLATLSSTGTLISKQRYLPFGAQRTDINGPLASPTDYGYTGQRQLDTGMGGIMDYKARFYSPYINRFLQPDSIIPDLSNPQDWNRFSYVYNNPVRYNDPTGHCPIICLAVLVGTFFVLNGVSGDAYNPNLSPQELESRQNSINLGVGILASVYSLKIPAVEMLSNAYDCATGFCDPNLMLPGSASAYYEALEDGITKIPARDIRWTQDTITRMTSDGIYLDDLADDMMLNGWNGDPLRVVNYEGAMWSIDNRRLAAAKLADIEVPAILYDSPSVLDPKLAQKWADHFTTKTGQTIEIVERRNGSSLGIKINMGGSVIAE